MVLPDMQNAEDTRGVDINEVGICGVKKPMKIWTRPAPGGGIQSAVDTVAEIDMGVRLDAEQKGTHMSRFQTILTSSRYFDISNMETYLQRVCGRLESSEAFVRMTAPMFAHVTAPASKNVGVIDYTVYYRASYRMHDSRYFQLIGVKCPTTSLCPCSKEISAAGAHNQRALVTIQLAGDSFSKTVWFEDLADVALASGSCPVYPILKREDEKFVTEAAYANPKFVEDVARDVALTLQGSEAPQHCKQASWAYIFVASQESIHNHNAYARIERGERTDLVDEFKIHFQ